MLGIRGSSPSGRNMLTSSCHSEMLWWHPLADTPMNGLGMKHGKSAELPPDLTADLAVGGQPVGGQLGPVEGEVELELPGRVLVVALDHVEAHGAAVLDDPVDDRLQLGELVDVVAVRLRHPLDRRRPVGVGLEPHHLGLAAGPQGEPGVGGELLVQPVQVAPAVRGQVAAGVLDLLPAPEQGAEHPRHLGVPGQRLKVSTSGRPTSSRRLGPVADVLAVAVDEEVGGRPVDELEALLRDRRPVRGRDALAHHPPGHRDELEVDVGDALGLDPPGHFVHLLTPAVPFEELLEGGGHGPPVVPVAADPVNKAWKLRSR